MNRLRGIGLLFCFQAMIAACPPVIMAEVVGSSQVVTKTVIGYKDTLKLNFLHDASLYSQGWDTLAQVKFWRQVLSLTGDTCIINVAACRQPLQKICNNEWSQLTDNEKLCLKDSLACQWSMVNGQPSTVNLFVTKGKSEFYELKRVLPEISKAIGVFEQNDVDPWYAQTILLIESPGKSKAKSSVGANGPFQLMRTVARKYGLIVSRKRDDRTSLEKSAKVAAKLLKASCIPYIKQYLAEQNLAYNETDLWFRLLVLHAYHAGAGNVHCVLNQIKPKTGGVALMTQLWQTECGRFKNESQNYSQIALASISLFDELIQADGDTVFLVAGDKKFSKYSRTVMSKGILVDKSAHAFQYLSQCLSSYENDLVDGTIPFDYFMKRVGKIRKEMKLVAKDSFGVVAPSSVKGKKSSALNPSPGMYGEADYTIYPYPASQEQILSVASRLINKQRFDEAINLIKTNLESRPNSAPAYAFLAKAYLQSGNKHLAVIYANRSMVAKTSSDTDKD